MKVSNRAARNASHHVVRGSIEIVIDHYAGVCNPTPYSDFLLNELQVVSARTALDVGTGSGILAIAVAKMFGADVLATDINERCLRATLANAGLNHVSSLVHAVRSDVFSNIPRDSRFDLIICNPPSLPMPVEPKSGSPLDCYYGGKDGRAFLSTLIGESPKYLADKGVLLFVTTSLAGSDRVWDLLVKSGLCFEVIARQELQFRDFYFQFYHWFQSLAQRDSSLFVERDGVPFEVLYLVKSCLR